MLTAANGKKLEAKLVFSRSLKYFYDTAKTEIPRGSGATWVDDEVKWILTVPAIWGDRAKAFMIEAAKDVSQLLVTFQNFILKLDKKSRRSDRLHRTQKLTKESIF